VPKGIPCHWWTWGREAFMKPVYMPLVVFTVRRVDVVVFGLGWNCANALPSREKTRSKCMVG
jgi:hypothetical protein